MKNYLSRITSGGYKQFLKRLVNSSFGLKTLKREIRGIYLRKKILSDLLSREEIVLKNRKELESLLGVPALINDPEVLALQKYAKEAVNLITEIGCAYGGSSLLFMLGKKKNTRVVSIDPFVKDSMGEFQASEELCSKYVKKALVDLGKDDDVKDWKLIPDFSYEVVKKWNEKIDLLFIDGDHTYEAVKQDFEEWFPFVKKGGVIVFHDSNKTMGSPEDKYSFGWPGPTKLVKELENNPKVSVIYRVYSLSFLRKNEE